MHVPAAILCFNFETGVAVVGHPSPAAGPSSSYPYGPGPESINFTFLQPIAKPANLTRYSDRLYVSTLLRGRYYVLLVAFGPLVPQANNFPGCISG